MFTGGFRRQLDPAFRRVVDQNTTAPRTALNAGKRALPDHEFVARFFRQFTAVRLNSNSMTVQLPRNIIEALVKNFPAWMFSRAFDKIDRTRNDATSERSTFFVVAGIDIPHIFTLAAIG